jgi:hypothetical protein
LVIGNPAFDLNLEPVPASTIERSPDIASRQSLSRNYHGLRFTPLPNTEVEARSIAKLLGGDGELLLGAEARERELKSVRSPRVLHLATHGFFLSDQEFKQAIPRPSNTTVWRMGESSYSVWHRIGWGESGTTTSRDIIG